VTATRRIAKQRIVLGTGWSEGITINTVAPSPAAETTDDQGRWVLAYDEIPAGGVLKVRLEIQVNPTTTGRRDQGVEVRDGAVEVARPHRHHLPVAPEAAVDIIVRAAATFTLLFVITRIMGRRELGEMEPFADASFDAVTSVFGAMFAPDHARTASEMLRVCRPGGTIALASWTPEGLIGDLFRTIGAHVPPPAGVRPPMLWGAEAHLREPFGDGVADMAVTPRTDTSRFRAPEGFVDFFRRWYGPTVTAFAALEGEARDALERDLVDLARRWDRLGDGATAIRAAYAEVVMTRR
jgi:SAM-dependent methyltransferase